MQGDDLGVLLAGIEADGQVQPILQRLAVGIVVPIGILQILEGRIKDFGERGHGSHLLPVVTSGEGVTPGVRTRPESCR